MHNNELPSKERELKLNNRAATSKLYYLLQWRRRAEEEEEEEETFYKSFGVGSKMQIQYSRAEKEMGLRSDEG
jgi:hypothetical protein